MHEPKVSALSARDRYYIARVHYITKPVMHTQLVFKYLVLLTYPKQPLVFEKCALSDLMRSHVIDSEASDLLSVT